MKWIKTALVSAAIAAAAATAAPSASAGEKTLGLNAGYCSYNHSAIAGVEFTYRFLPHLRLAPSVLYAFRNKHRDAMIINLNFHSPFSLSPLAWIYPLAGVNYSSWNFHHQGQESDDVSTRDSRFGLNAGAGLGLRLPGNLRLGVEGYYTFIKHYHGANVMAKIAYSF